MAAAYGSYQTAEDALGDGVLPTVNDTETQDRVSFSTVARLGVAGMAFTAAAVMGVALSSSQRQSAADSLLKAQFDPRQAGSGSNADQDASTMAMPVGADGTYEGTYMFKKTYNSLNPTEDVAFVQDAFGLMVDINTTVYCSPGSPGFNTMTSPCAKRAGVISSMIPEIHFFQSFVSPQGVIPVEDWINMWIDMNSNFNSSFEWHEFMHMASTFYTPDLTPFLKRWEEKQYARLHRKYTSGLDGKTMYSVRMQVPHTGTIMEVIADHVDKKWVDDFEEYKATECGPSTHIPFTQKQLKTTWTKEGGNDVNSSTIGEPGVPSTFGLPLMMLVQVSHPATDKLDDLKTYLEENTGYSNHYKEHTDDTQDCSWSDLTVAQLIASSDGSDDDEATSDAVKVNLRLTMNNKAAQGPMTAAFYGHYTTTTIQENVGNNEGYSRYLDNHIGIDIANVATLDENALLLQTRDFAFHSGGGAETAADGAGTDDDDDDDDASMTAKSIARKHGRRRLGLETNDTYAGSNWARGKSGVNFEFRGTYQGNATACTGTCFFNVSEIVQLDYCSPTGFSISGISDVTYCPKIEERPSS